MFLTIYKPEGVHTKANPCNCGYCDIYPEFFHAPIHKTYTVNSIDMAFAKSERDQKYPGGIILWSSTGDNRYIMREDGSKVTYNKKEHCWYEANGEKHSKNN